MSIRDILVHTDPTEASVLRTRYAAQLAEQFGAHLTGVFLRQTLAYQYLGTMGGSYAVVPIAIPEDIVRDYNEAMDQTALEVRSKFQATADDMQISIDWRSINGDFAGDMVDAMRRTDLTVLPGAHLLNAGTSDLEPAFLGLSSGGPIVVTPDAFKSAEKPARRIIVAWDGRREAARALHDAWPLIEKADQVSILVVSKDPQSGVDVGLLERFGHHGVEAELVVVEKPGSAAGEVILDEVRKRHADLVVMGLFGHTRAREFVLGGASRDLLKAAPVPLFMSH